MYLGERPLEISLTSLQLSALVCVRVLQADHGLLSLLQLSVELLQLTPEGHHLTRSLCHLVLTLSQLLLEQRDLTGLLTQLHNKHTHVKDIS